MVFRRDEYDGHPSRPFVLTTHDFLRRLDQAEAAGIRKVVRLLRADPKMHDLILGADDPVAAVEEWGLLRSLD